jgi:hypothetical protein
VLPETDDQEIARTRMTPNGIAGSLGTQTFPQSEKFQVIDAGLPISRFPPVPFPSRRWAAKERDKAGMDVARMGSRATHRTEPRTARP